MLKYILDFIEYLGVLEYRLNKFLQPKPTFDAKTEYFKKKLDKEREKVE